MPGQNERHLTAAKLQARVRGQRVRREAAQAAANAAQEPAANVDAAGAAPAVNVGAVPSAEIKAIYNQVLHDLQAKHPAQEQAQAAPAAEGVAAGAAQAAEEKANSLTNWAGYFNAKKDYLRDYFDVNHWGDNIRHALSIDNAIKLVSLASVGFGGYYGANKLFGFSLSQVKPFLAASLSNLSGYKLLSWQFALWSTSTAAASTAVLYGAYKLNKWANRVKPAWEILGVDADASSAEVEAAFKQKKESLENGWFSKLTFWQKDRKMAILEKAKDDLSNKKDGVSYARINEHKRSIMEKKGKNLSEFDFISLNADFEDLGISLTEEGLAEVLSLQSANKVAGTMINIDKAALEQTEAIQGSISKNTKTINENDAKIKGIKDSLVKKMDKKCDEMIKSVEQSIKDINEGDKDDNTAKNEVKLKARVEKLRGIKATLSNPDVLAGQIKRAAFLQSVIERAQRKNKLKMKKHPKPVVDRVSKIRQEIVALDEKLAKPGNDYAETANLRKQRQVMQSRLVELQTPKSSWFGRMFTPKPAYQRCSTDIVHGKNGTAEEAVQAVQAVPAK